MDKQFYSYKMSIMKTISNIRVIFLVAIIFGNPSLTFPLTMSSECCQSATPDSGTDILDVSCTNIKTLDDLKCLTNYLNNVSSVDVPLDVQISDCNHSLFIDEYFKPYQMAGLTMMSCDYRHLPVVLYARICVELTTTLSFQSNKITIVPSRSFIGCVNLETLDLSGNNIVTIHPDSFLTMYTLKTLFLFGNNIRTLDSNGFQNLSMLLQLYMYDNKINDIKAEAFVNVKAVQQLFLYNNQVTTLPNGVLNGFGPSFIFDIHGNPFNCICSFQWFQEWLNGHSSSSGGDCATPTSGPMKSYDFCPPTTTIDDSTTTTPTTTASTTITSTTTTSTATTSATTTSDMTTPATTTPTTTSTTPTTTTLTTTKPTTTTPDTTTLTTTTSATTTTTPTTITLSTLTPTTSTTPTPTTTLPSKSSTARCFETTSSIETTPLSEFTTTVPDNNIYDINVHNFNLLENLTMTWETNASKVAIIYSPVNESCSSSSISDYFMEKSAGIHAVIVKNTNHYKIDDYYEQYLYLVCVTSAERITPNNFQCDNNCLNTITVSSSSNDDDNSSSVSSQTVVPLSVLLGVVIAVVLLAIIIMIVLLCLLRWGKKNGIELEEPSTISEITSNFERPLPEIPNSTKSLDKKTSGLSEKSDRRNPMYYGSHNTDYVDLVSNVSETNYQETDDDRQIPVFYDALTPTEEPAKYVNTSQVLPSDFGESDPDNLYPSITNDTADVK
ncbi:Leucine rich repeat containing 15 [Chamberlinius hualienensis]